MYVLCVVLPGNSRIYRYVSHLKTDTNAVLFNLDRTFGRGSYHWRLWRPGGWIDSSSGAEEFITDHTGEASVVFNVKVGG